MSASAWSFAKLLELHRSFLEMRRLPSVADRRNSSFRIVASRASMVRLEDAVVKCPSCPVDRRADILQEATLVLVESFSAESIHYTDQGTNEFGTWYWTVCSNACARAARRLREAASDLVEFVDSGMLAHVSAAPDPRRSQGG
jgi:hypothetical protein